LRRPRDTDHGAENDGEEGDGVFEAGAGFDGLFGEVRGQEGVGMKRERGEGFERTSGCVLSARRRAEMEMRLPVQRELLRREWRASE
jgi:hypothetical protein